jgi:hypothetical protein
LPSRSSKPALNAAAPQRRRSTPKLRRPSLGGPELQMPKFATDLYADLRDRHLLPLVALLIVAIIAAPILLSGGGKEETPAITPAGVEGETKTAGLTVVPAEDGLRDYKRRLGHRTPLDPFRRPPEAEAANGEASSASSSSGSGSNASPTSEGSSESSASVESSSSSSQEVSTSTVGGVTTEKVEPTSSGSSGGRHHKQHKSGQSESSAGKSSGHESTGAKEASEPTESSKSAESTHVPANNGGTSESSTAKGVSAVVGYTIDAQAGFVPKTSEKTDIAPMTKLPNKKHPLILYMGLSKNHKRALFLMTSYVTAYYGGHCALDKQACQLVEVAPGKGITFAVGYGKTRYKLHLKSIVPVVKRAH